MNTQRITISLPDYLYKQIIVSVPARKISNYIANIVEEKIICKKDSCDPVGDFFCLRKQLPKTTTKEILNAIGKGRE